MLRLFFAAFVGVLLAGCATELADSLERGVPLVEQSCDEIFIDHTPEMTAKLAGEHLVQVGGVVEELSADGVKVSSAVYETVDAEVGEPRRATQYDVTCTSKCVDCGISGCNVVGTTCSGCECTGGDCSGCECEKTVTQSSSKRGTWTRTYEGSGSFSY